MKIIPTLSPALLLAAAIPAADQTLDYATLCGATEGTGDNNDFCTLWAQGNHQGMRNALSIAIRTARAAENRNRYYFDHKRGAERGAFIQLKRPWMGEDWQVRRQVWQHTDEIWVFNPDRNLGLWIELEPRYNEFIAEPTRLGEAGYSRVQMYGLGDTYRARGQEGGFRYNENRTRRHQSSDTVRRIVESKIDEYGWEIGEVDVRPDCEGIEE